MEEYPGPKLIVFVAGGVTFSEMRSIYELAALKSREVILVSSQTLTARQFIKELNATHSL